ncbi:inactive pancreatic lipase-related protein 1-like [Haliotis cracherodii]|uniref:inactive pancreatic lipase-related protein 1-like n=1 Tax=Haliotis cracherodii TaxID=6455 RepID=UPI0039E80BC4
MAQTLAPALAGILLLLAEVASVSTRHNGVREHYRHHHHRREHDSHGVCYPGVGCFSSSYPFNNTGEVPQDPQFIGTVFRLFTRQRPTVPDVLETGNRQSLIESTFDHRLPVKIILHGFLARSTLDWVMNLTMEFLRKEPMNIITVDWGRGAGFPYIQAAANTRLVGAEVANLILFLNHETGSQSSQYHLIGHSLGAHISGYAGHRLPGTGRITGLDPAEPNFQGLSPMVRLDPTDADFVDVIHTDGSPFETLGGFGMITPVGHVDFYPNGGVQQPGCPEDSWSSFMSSAYSSGVEEAELNIGCNHNRASELFVESVNSPCPFTAFPCSNITDFNSGNCFHCGNSPCPVMGYPSVQTQARGSFYLDTRPTRPYCGYHYFVSMTLADTMTVMHGSMEVRLFGSRGQTHTMELHSGAFTPGEVMQRVFVTSSDIGDIEDVHVTFQRVYSYFDYLGFWGTGNGVHLQRMTTVAVHSHHRRVFCPSQRAIRSGASIWLSHGVQASRSTC